MIARIRPKVNGAEAALGAICGQNARKYEYFCAVLGLSQWLDNLVVAIRRSNAHRRERGRCAAMCQATQREMNAHVRVNCATQRVNCATLRVEDAHLRVDCATMRVVCAPLRVVNAQGRERGSFAAIGMLIPVV